MKPWKAPVLMAVIISMMILMSGCMNSGSPSVLSVGSNSSETDLAETTYPYDPNFGSTSELPPTETFSTSSLPSKTDSTTAPAPETSPVTSTQTQKTATSTTAKNTGADNQNGEMRAVWISYIELNKIFNGKTVEQAKSELDKVMDNIRSYGLNAVIFHVRSHSNAYYKSSIFASATSVSGLISQGFDPLAYAVEAAHARGLQFHAWVNPYRVGREKSFAKNDDIFTDGEQWYYIPTSVTAQQLISDGIVEVVKNYDVDGVQFDDYFYPNSSSLIPKDKPAGFEASAFSEYQKAGGRLSVTEWRRTNVSAMVRNVYNRVKTNAKNKKAVFGISPRNDVKVNYNGLYADVSLWMSSAGYIDYITPQIYFGFNHPSAPFIKQTDLWTGYARHSSVSLYIGLPLYKSGTLDADTTEWTQYNDIVKRQVEYIRKSSSVSGFMVYTYSSFAEFPEEAANLKSVLQ